MISYIEIEYHTRMSCRILNTYLNPAITYGKLCQFPVTLSHYLLLPPCAANTVLATYSEGYKIVFDPYEAERC
jgi:hypothetical protein